MKPPEFRKGNASIRNALNLIVEYSKKHGVNPAGLPGWSQSADGWVPPLGGPASSDAVRQWQIRLRTEGEGEDPEVIAEIRGGGLYGLGFSGFNLGDYFDNIDWQPDEWIEISNRLGFSNSQNNNVWLKLLVRVVGAPFTYYSSPDQVETIWLPTQVDEASVELHFTVVGDSIPEVIQPTINSQTGESVVEGEYYLRIGEVSIEDNSFSNDFLGPLGIGWCPPSGPYLVQLT